ncbi:MAG TPA: Ig-like domain-containing protein, partial [Roseimicrobium sp.]|nr:Ig-like domain-containing protein [Roseimicrobium sp.]
VITIEPVNDRPSIELTAPTNLTTVRVGSTVLLSASAADVDGVVTNVAFWDGATRLANLSSPPYVWSWTGALPGTHSIKAVATDNLGLSSTSSIAVVSIQLPAQTNLALWLKADSIVGLATGTGISQWPDSGGKSNHFVQSSSGQRPLWIADGGNGIPVVRFDGGDDQMTGQRNPATNDFTAVLVLKPTAWHEIDAVGSDGGYTGQRYIFGTKASPPPGQSWAMVSMGNNGVSLYEDGNYVSGSYRRTALAVQSGDYSGGFQMVSISCSNSLQQLFINGFYQQESLLPSQSNLVFSAVMGSSSSPAVGGAFAGDVAEILVFNRTLTADERLSVERYVNYRYQLQTNPPAAVTDLVGIAVGTNQVALTWSLSASNGATAFRLERRTGVGEFFPIAPLPGAERSYFDTGLAPGQAYGYRIVPINVVSDGSPSTEVIVVTGSSGTGIPVNAMATWLRRGSGMTIDGSGRVSRWEDASGKGNHFSKSGTIALPMVSRRADGGVESLFFSGSEGLRAVRPCGTNGFTAFAVARTFVGHEMDQEADYEGGNYFERFVFFPRTTFTYSDAASGLSFATNGLSAYEGYNQQVGSFRMPSSLIFTNNLGTGRHIIGYCYEDLYPRVFVDGSPVRSTWPRERTTVYGPYDLGGDGNNFGRSMIGDLYEVMVFDRVLTWEEQHAVHEYLNASFGVTTNLLSGPSISRPAGQVVDEDAPVGPIPLTFTDRTGNPDGLVLSARTSDESLLPAAGIAFSGTGTNRVVTLQPGTNQYGSAHVQITVTDQNGLRDYASFPVTIAALNDPPLADSFSLTLIEDSSISFNLIGTDPEAAAISFQITQMPLYGTIAGTPPKLVYTPATNYFGADTLQYTVSDGGKTSSVATVSFTVLLGDDDPPVAQGATITLLEDQAKQMTLGASDPDGDALSYVITQAPSH